MADHRTRGSHKRSWGKWLLISAGVLAVLLIGAYFLATSSFFLKKVILPKAGAALNAKITVGDASISPFSEVHLTGLEVRTTGTEPLLTAQDVRLRYSLMDILRGNINVDEVTLSGPVLHIIQEVDGSSNLDPLLEGQDEAEEKPSTSDEPLKVDIKNFALKNGTLKQTEKSAAGGSKQTEVRDLNVTLDRLANGASGKLAVEGALMIAQRSGTTNDVLRASISGGYDLALTEALLPQSAKGSLKVVVAEAQGAYKEAANLTTSLDADLTPTEIRELALKFDKGGQDLGRLRVSGPFDASKMEGTLKVEVIGIDENLLSIAAAGQGMSFGESRINFVNEITISQNATFFAASGTLMGRRISVTRENMTTPEMDVSLGYRVTVNLADETAVLQDLNLSANQENREFLRASLDRQMNLSWGTAVRGYKDASLNLVLTNFNLAKWRAVIGTNLSTGVVNLQMAVASQQDGKLLNMEINGQASDLSGQFGTNQWADAALTFSASGKVEEMKVINFSKYSFSLRQNNTDVLQANGAARYSLENSDISAQVTAEAALPRLLALGGVADVQASTGNLKISANFADAGGKQSANGNVALEQFTGAMQEYQFNNFQIALEYTLAMDSQMVDIQRAAATFSQAFNAGGSVDIKGRYDLEKEAGTFAYKIVNLNENTFGPFLAPSLGEKKLVSIALNGSGEAKLDPAGETTVQTELKVSNWQVEDAGGKSEPLSAGLKLDGGMREEVLTLRQALVQLSPTERAKNTLQLEGTIDLRTNNAAPSTLTLSSEGFDVTPYYNMFAADSPAESAAPADAPAPAEGAAEGEPEPMTLPFKQFTAKLKLDRLFLNEIAISNWVGTVAIQDSTIRIDPFTLNVNGGPVSIRGEVDVGVAGYRYDLGFKADRVPLEPLANSFSTTNEAGQLQGNLIADARIRGAGITGPNLQKNLAGTASFNLTNLNYQIVGPKLKRILVPISAVLRAPELTQTPINWAAGATVISNGVVNLQRMEVQSEAFFAEVQGIINLEPVLTNSPLSLPVDLSLRRSLAEKAHVLPANTPADAKYAKLPRFVSIQGTLGAPEPEINKLALASQVLQSAASLGLGNEKTEELLGNLGELGAKFSSGNTNKAANGTNASPSGSVGNLLRGFLGGKEAEGNSTPAGTNAPATNAPAKSNPLDFFKNLQKEK